MTTLGGLAKRYDVLNVDERFRLSLAARVRGDHAEEDRLDLACPKLTYTMADARYLDRWRGLDEIAIRVFGILTMFERSHAWRRATAASSAGLGEWAAKLAGLAWLSGWEGATAAAGVFELPMPEGGARAALGRVADPEWIAGIWRDVAAEAEAEGRLELAAFWSAFDAWAVEATGQPGADLLIGIDRGDVGPYTLGLIELATAAAAECEPDAELTASFRASLDMVWRRHVRE